MKYVYYSSLISEAGNLWTGSAFKGEACIFGGVRGEFKNGSIGIYKESIFVRGGAMCNSAFDIGIPVTEGVG